MAVILEFSQKRNAPLGVLDSLLERGLITRTHHWCGVHFRWLWNIHLGLVTVDGNAAWKEAREYEYYRALTTLEDNNAIFTITRLCIHDDPESSSRINAIRSGLSMLANLWEIKESTHEK